VASAAVSTLVAFALALAWMARRWLRASHPLAPNVELLCQIRFDLPTVQRMLRIGIPSSLQMFTAALAEIVLLGLVNGHGYNATAAYGAVNQVMSWIQLPAMSLGITATVLSAHAIGAGRNQRVLDIVRAGLWLNIVVTGAVVSIVYFMAPAVISLFLTDGPTASLAQDLLRTVAWSVVILGAANVVVGAMRASGTVLWPAMLGMVSILGVEVPFAYWLHSRIGISGIWWAYTVGFGAMLLLQSMYFKWGWRRQRIERLV
jgi:Na+-driven multidrug efflux pump